MVKNTDAKTLQGFVRKTVLTDATLLATDGLPAYTARGKAFVRGYAGHFNGRYGSGNVHTNGIKGFWSQPKRQIIGIYHWASAKHLDRYVSDASWRYYRRKVSEGNRVDALIAKSAGRLTSTALIA